VQVRVFVGATPTTC